MLAETREKTATLTLPSLSCQNEQGDWALGNYFDFESKCKRQLEAIAAVSIEPLVPGEDFLGGRTRTAQGHSSGLIVIRSIPTCVSCDLQN